MAVASLTDAFNTTATFDCPLQLALDVNTRQHNDSNTKHSGNTEGVMIAERTGWAHRGRIGVRGARVLASSKEGCVMVVWPSSVLSQLRRQHGRATSAARVCCINVRARHR